MPCGIPHCEKVFRERKKGGETRIKKNIHIRVKLQRREHQMKVRRGERQKQKIEYGRITRREFQNTFSFLEIHRNLSALY